MLVIFLLLCCVFSIISGGGYYIHIYGLPKLEPEPEPEQEQEQEQEHEIPQPLTDMADNDVETVREILDECIEKIVDDTINNEDGEVSENTPLTKNQKKNRKKNAKKK